MIINNSDILKILSKTKDATNEEIEKVLKIADTKKGLDIEQIAILLNIKEKNHLEKLLKIAGKIKEEIYGNRLVIFAPLYISNYCVNNCTYCGYKKSNAIPRKKLTMNEIQKEVELMEKAGHKRIALEVGEDPVHCDIDYVLDAIKAIYNTKNENGSIRRINVNIAATTVENYKKLKDANIGTYILFQETYHQETYEKVHPNSLKGDYHYHLTAFDRAMEAGIDDVGAGVLFGLANYKYEVLSLMLHNNYLEEKFGVGFHTISVPRIKKAEGMTLDMFTHVIDDETFIKIVAILRVAVPYTGIILSTRESENIRKHLIQYGVSQISAGSCTDVGGYSDEEQGITSAQFEIADHRKPIDILKELIKDKHIPSYCTACYRSGRTGDRFMRLAKSGEIHNVCTPNALMTLMEFITDYGDEEIYHLGYELIMEEISKISNEKIKNLTLNNLKRINNGERDLFL
ncbi:iron-only hydrogenase maturation protein HydG [Natranaerovirga pectinivora]|uniref:Iron-only hydrogenase maturation protein HydG n=1 Tax=Natranaerovirga pectinivora TaxID=682400 RepID=A0A4R3MP62_9FIRM|nr:[FeFe] hydrogenase H-cluster radical SAM maturase HydG [Natranaerovirga pectinivora]TCT16312.1 iron-only hydrogenase maturation protein HydG [Natranaerovirga pectinivora]